MKFYFSLKNDRIHITRLPKIYRRTRRFAEVKVKGHPENPHSRDQLGLPQNDNETSQKVSNFEHESGDNRNLRSTMHTITKGWHRSEKSILRYQGGNCSQRRY